MRIQREKRKKKTAAEDAEAFRHHCDEAGERREREACIENT